VTTDRLDAAESAERAQRERARIAAILHDELQQTLAAAHLHLSLPDGAAEAQVLLKQAIAETRALSHELAGPPPDAPLLTRLRALANHFEARYRVRVDTAELVAIDGGAMTAEAVSAAAQELLYNAVRHAGGVGLRLSSATGDGWAVVWVRDAGPGAPTGSVSAGGLGLREVRRRLEALGGYVDFDSRSSGTTVSLCFPTRAPAQATPPLR